MDFSTYLKNKRIQGATLVGFGLVAGAFVVSNFGQTSPAPIAPPAAIAAAPVRNYIPVVDSTGDGIEDWRAEFVAREPVVLAVEPDTTTPEYVPETITEAMSVQFLQNVLQAKAGFGVQSNDEIVEATVSRVAEVATDRLYTTRDITVVPTSPESIRNYANAIGQNLTDNNVDNYEDEITIIDRALKMQSEAELQKLLPLENMYRQMRDQALRTPVPQSLAKEHLDIVNVFNALHAGLRDVRSVYDDPVVALMRVKRYQDDATGLANSMRNLYLALEPNANLFTPDDPAVVLVAFAPNFQ